MNRERRFLLSFFGARNLGDDLMLLCLERWLKRFGVRVALLTEEPERTAVLYPQYETVRNVPLLGEWAWFDTWFRGKGPQLLSAMREYDGLVTGGGDFIRDDFSRAAFLFSIEKLLISRALGRPAYLMNTGLGEMRTGLGRALTPHALRSCRQIVVRDRRSLAICERAGVAASYAPDIVYSLPQLFPEECRAGRAREGIEGSYALICLRTNANVYGQYAMTPERMQALALALDRLAAGGRTLAFFPLQSHDAEDDHKIHAELRQLLRPETKTVMLGWTSRISEVANRFARADLVIAMRLHAAILAAAFERPCAILPYDRKLREFAAQRGNPYLVEASSLDRADDTAAILERALANPATVPSQPPPADWTTLELKP
jgi:polysaccharide pyruvyl transferase CsaB